MTHRAESALMTGIDEAGYGKGDGIAMTATAESRQAMYPSRQVVAVNTLIGAGVNPQTAQRLNRRLERSAQKPPIIHPKSKKPEVGSIEWQMRRDYGPNVRL